MKDQNIRPEELVDSAAYECRLLQIAIEGLYSKLEDRKEDMGPLQFDLHAMSMQAKRIEDLLNKRFEVAWPTAAQQGA